MTFNAVVSFILLLNASHLSFNLSFNLCFNLSLCAKCRLYSLENFNFYLKLKFSLGSSKDHIHLCRPRGKCLNLLHFCRCSLNLTTETIIGITYGNRLHLWVISVIKISNICMTFNGHICCLLGLPSEFKIMRIQANQGFPRNVSVTQIIFFDRINWTEIIISISLIRHI